MPNHDQHAISTWSVLQFTDPLRDAGSNWSRRKHVLRFLALYGFKGLFCKAFCLRDSYPFFNALFKWKM